MAKVKQKSRPWYENLHDARGYKVSKTPNWPLYVALILFFLAIVGITKLL